MSGLLTPFGALAQIVRMVASGQIVVGYHARILAEYGEVYHRPKFDFPEPAISALLDQNRKRRDLHRDRSAHDRVAGPR